MHEKIESLDNKEADINSGIKKNNITIAPTPSFKNFAQVHHSGEIISYKIDSENKYIFSRVNRSDEGEYCSRRNKNAQNRSRGQSTIQSYNFKNLFIKTHNYDCNLQEPSINNETKITNFSSSPNKTRLIGIKSPQLLKLQTKNSHKTGKNKFSFAKFIKEKNNFPEPVQVNNSPNIISKKNHSKWKNPSTTKTARSAALFTAEICCNDKTKNYLLKKNFESSLEKSKDRGASWKKKYGKSNLEVLRSYRADKLTKNDFSYKRLKNKEIICIEKLKNDFLEKIEPCLYKKSPKNIVSNYFNI